MSKPQESDPAFSKVISNLNSLKAQLRRQGINELQKFIDAAVEVKGEKEAAEEERRALEIEQEKKIDEMVELIQEFKVDPEDLLKAISQKAKRGRKAKSKESEETATS